MILHASQGSLDIPVTINSTFVINDYRSVYYVFISVWMVNAEYWTAVDSVTIITDINNWLSWRVIEVEFAWK